MPDWRSMKLRRKPPTIPAVGAVPLQATSPLVAHESIKALDTLAGSGPRCWGRFGQLGGQKFLIPNGSNPSSGTSLLYPNKSTPRVVMRSKGTVLPGHFLGIDITALPSGPCQKFVEAPPPGSYEPDGAGGTVELEVVYTNSDAQTVTCNATVTLAASQSVYSAEPANAFASLIHGKAVAMPVPFNPSGEHWEKWTRGLVKFEATVSYIGSPRVIDGRIIEVPEIIVVDQAESRWPTAMYTASGEPYLQPPSEYPIEQRTSTDPGGGTKSIRRALYNHGRQYGPVLIAWTSATEHVGTIEDWVSYFSGTGDDEAPPYTVTGTTPTLVPFGATSWDNNLPGWPLGSYARQVNDGNHFLDGRTGVLPVFVHAYCRVSGGTGHFELKTDRVGWSAIPWTTTSTDWGWVTSFGRLEVGTGPEDGFLARLWARNSGANDTSIRYLIVEFASI